MGFFGYINDAGDTVIPSAIISSWIRSQEGGKSVSIPSHSWIKSIWGKSIIDKKAFYSSGTFDMPHDHIDISNFMTSPIIYEDRSIGLLSVANKDGGYNEEDKELLESITAYISPILYARLQRDRQETERKRTEQ